MDIKRFVRDIPDFPTKGIIFKDITPLLQEPKAFQQAVTDLAKAYKKHKIDTVVAIEARGFILGAPVALELGAGFVPIRKKGKLPFKTISAEYSLEYGTATIEMHRDGIAAGKRVLILDDVLATGGTAAAAKQLVEKCGAKVVGLGVLIELEFLNGRKKLPGLEIVSLIKY